MHTCNVCEGHERCSCDYWLNYIGDALRSGDKREIVTDDFRVYGLGDEDRTPAGSRGFGGALMVWENLTTGERIASTNAWNGSEIPERYRHLEMFRPTHRQLQIDYTENYSSVPRYFHGAFRNP